MNISTANNEQQCKKGDCQIASIPRKKELAEALSATGSAHHDYEQYILSGVREEQWSDFYAAYVLGRLGDFAAPRTLTRWLEEAPSDDNWAEATADHVLNRVR